jgi:hypothetical protein
MNKHTPAPWILQTVPTSAGVCHKIGPFPPKLGTSTARHACLYADNHSEYNPADKELLANAKLIAAAPELLEALELALEYWRHRQQRYKNKHPIWVEKADSAIAKARGEA